MSENIFTAVLTFSLLAGGTAVIGSEMFTPRQAQPTAAKTVLAQGMVAAPKGSAASQAVVLPTVTITGRRVEAMQVVTLPTVTITGRRDASTRVASAGSANEATRVE